jgi:hypothetical protein
MNFIAPFLKNDFIFFFVFTSIFNEWFIVFKKSNFFFALFSRAHSFGSVSMFWFLNM